MGITVVPLYVCFGQDMYRDREEITEEDFYQRLLQGPVHPTTTQPTPNDFVEVYRQFSTSVDGIVSIHISEKLSGTCNSARQAIKLVEEGCPIEVVDSETVSTALGLVVVAAATAAKAGGSLQQVAEAARQAIANTRILVLFDTLHYLAKGGRIGKAKSLLGSMLSVKPMLTITEGEFVPVGQVRTRSKGIEKLLEFVRSADGIEDLAVINSTTPDEAESLADSIRTIVPSAQTRVTRLGTALGVHGGPGVLAVTYRII